MKIVITGGHFSPAYSVLLKLKGDNEILVVGRRHAFDGDSGETFEYKVCNSLGIAFEEIKAGRLRRNFDSSAIFALAKFPKVVYEASKILKDFKPEVVVTFGGYVGLPVAIAAKMLGIPVVLHEQTQKAGLAARLISKFASVVLISFESSRKYFGNKKIILTGNPIRPEFYGADTNHFTIKKPSIYITGGSTGSHFINKTVEKILPSLLQDFQIYHQVGNSQEYNDIERLKEIDDKNYHVADFFTPEQVFELLKKSDLVISRAGINTICEMIACKTLSLLIPISVGQINEQLDNAKLVKSLGIGEFIEQKDVSAEKLLSMINDMIKNRKNYQKNVINAQKVIHHDSVEKIIYQIYLYGKRRERKEISTIE